MKKLLYPCFLILFGCSTIYYNFWEVMGREKRDLLKSNVSKVEQQQKEVQETFKDTLTRIQTKYDYKKTKIDEIYEDLSDDYNKSKSQSENLSLRIDNAEEVASDLFKEWNKEAYKI